MSKLQVILTVIALGVLWWHVTGIDYETMDEWQSRQKATYIRVYGDQTEKEPTYRTVELSPKPAMLHFDIIGYRELTY